MIPEERCAEKIAELFGKYEVILYADMYEEIVAEIADACRLAVEEAIQEFVRVSLEDDPRLQHFKLQLQKEGALKVYEDAAKIAEEWMPEANRLGLHREYDLMRDIAATIRARAAEVSK